MPEFGIIIRIAQKHIKDGWQYVDSTWNLFFYSADSGK